MTIKEHAEEWMKKVDQDIRMFNLDQLIILLNEVALSEREECAQLAEYHRPERFRGGYAEGLIVGDPMWDIAKEIRNRSDNVH
jgi:hypothetical protein